MLFEFIVCVLVAVSGISFLTGVLLAGPSSYERGRRDQARLQAADDADRRRAGFRVVS